MREIRTSGLMSGEGKRSPWLCLNATAPFLELYKNLAVAVFGCWRLIAHELEPVDVDQAHVGDLEVRDHRERQERDLQERLGERHA